VDNTAPEVSITYPLDGDTLAYADNRQITFQATGTDNLSLSDLEFYVDRKLVGSVETAPFTLTWNARRGEHELRVVARDRAENKSEEKLQFTVK
jgi:hypothetical protein